MSRELNEERYARKLERRVSRIVNLKEREPKEREIRNVAPENKPPYDDGEPKGIRDPGTGKVSDFDKIKFKANGEIYFTDAHGQNLAIKRETFCDIIASIVETNWK